MKTPNCIPGLRFRSSAFPLLLTASMPTGLCLSFGPVLAGDKGETNKQTTKEVGATQKKKSEDKTVITGSLIPQKVKPNRIPVTTSPVIIISRSEIERSGGSTLAEVLRRQGASR